MNAWDWRAHTCGCTTVFDLGVWESVALMRCADHARHDKKFLSGNRSSSTSVGVVERNKP